jgi:hypothetical protein
VTAASCATEDALWFTDGRRAFARSWAGKSTRSETFNDSDVSLLCGAHVAYALLDEDDGPTLVSLAAGDGGKPKDAGTGRMRLFDEASFGEDDQRERAEFANGDDVGLVRLGVSGALAVREVRAGTRGPLQKLKTVLPHDDDVVAVDASASVIAVVYTEDLADSCPDAGGSASAPALLASTRVMALRIDRTTFEESTHELSPGSCGREVGPFFTGALGDGVAIAWVERVAIPTQPGQARAPIAGLAHRVMPKVGAPPALGHVDEAADALVDAGCDAHGCYAVALTRKPGMDAMVPGVVRVIRYP